MPLADTLTFYNFVMEQKKKGIPIGDTLANEGVSTNEFYYKCKRLNLKKWSEQNPKYIRTDCDIHFDKR